MIIDLLVNARGTRLYILKVLSALHFSSLCGNAKQLLSSGLCSSWEDALWARCKAMVDTLVEEELRRSMPRSYLAMPAEYWDNLTRLGDVFQSL